MYKNLPVVTSVLRLTHPVLRSWASWVCAIYGVIVTILGAVGEHCLEP